MSNSAIVNTLRDEYFNVLDRYFYHSYDAKYTIKLHDITTYIVIILSALTTLISGIKLLFVGEAPSDSNTLWADITILLVSFFTTIISGYSKFKEFPILSQKHTDTHVQCENIMNDIVDILSDENLMGVEIKNEIIKRTGDMKKIAPNVSKHSKNLFKKKKDIHAEYQRKVNKINTISSAIPDNNFNLLDLEASSEQFTNSDDSEYCGAKKEFEKFLDEN